MLAEKEREGSKFQIMKEKKKNDIRNRIMKARRGQQVS